MAGGPTGVYFLAFFLSEPQAAPYREVDQSRGTVAPLLLLLDQFRQRKSRASTESAWRRLGSTCVESSS